MVGEMVQNSQSLYAFTFNVLIDIHEDIYSHSTTEITFLKLFIHIYLCISYSRLYLLTFTRCLHSRDRGAGGAGGASGPPIISEKNFSIEKLLFTAFIDMR